MNVTVNVQGITGAINHIQEIKKEIAGSQGTLYHDIGGILADSIVDNFHAEGRPQWESRKGTYSHPILDKTGAMRDFAEQSARFGNWQHSAKKHILKILTMPYGIVHQNKGDRSGVVRKYVRMVATDTAKVLQRFRRIFK